MSSGQRPRRPEHYPWMKYRGRARRRHRSGVYITWRGENWRAMWPQPDMTSPMYALIAEYGGSRYIPVAELVRLHGLDDPALTVTIRNPWLQNDLDDDSETA